MSESSQQAGNNRPPSLQQSITATVAGSSGINGNNINGNLIQYNIDKIKEAVRCINGIEAKAAFRTFMDLPPKERVIALNEVRLDKGANLLAALQSSKGHEAVVSLLINLDENRLVEFLSPNGVRQRLGVEIIATLPPEKIPDLFAKLGSTHPASAAELLDRLIATQHIPGGRTGLDAAIAALPTDRADRQFLAHLPATPTAVDLLAKLAEGERRNLLTELPSEDLRQRLVLGGPSNAEPLIAVLPMDRAVQELNLLPIKELRRLLAGLSPGQSVQLTNQMPVDRVAVVLGDSPLAGPRLEQMNRDRASQVIEKMPPKQAAALLKWIRMGTASQLLQRLPNVSDDWLSTVWGLMPIRLRAALLDRIALDSPQTAERLRTALPELRQPGTTGWSVLDTMLSLLATARPVSRRLGAKSRGSERLSSALSKEVAEVRKLWRSLRQSSARKPVNYRTQRNHLGIGLILVLVALGVTVALPNVPRTTPVRSSPTRPLVPTHIQSAISDVSERTGLQALSVYRRDWSGRDCSTWVQENSQFLDANNANPVHTLLTLSCQLQTANNIDLSLIWYPPTSPPGGDPFFQRPVTAGAYQMVTSGNLPSQWPKWSGTGSMVACHGTYLEYYPDKGRAAIWLEDDEESVAVIIFGPPGGGDTFTELQVILNNHGYHLS